MLQKIWHCTNRSIFERYHLTYENVWKRIFSPLLIVWRMKTYHLTYLLIVWKDITWRMKTYEISSSNSYRLFIFLSSSFYCCVVRLMSILIITDCSWHWHFQFITITTKTTMTTMNTPLCTLVDCFQIAKNAWKYWRSGSRNRIRGLNQPSWGCWLW